MNVAIGAEFATRRDCPLSFRVRVVHILLIAAALLTAVAPASGHGILQGSSPGANAVLPSPPPEVVLAFNESIDAAFSRADVVDGAGQGVGRPAQVSAGGLRMRVVLDRLPPGVYTVRWRVLSRVDGHVTSGAFLFAVGEATAPQGRADTGERVVPSLVLARWMTLLAALVLAGVVVFEALILRPVLPTLPPDTARLVREGALPRLDALRVIAGGVLIVAVLLEFVAQSAAVLGGAVETLGRRAVLAPLVEGTRAGWSLLVRAFMALILLAPARGPWRILRAAALVWFVVVATVIVVLGGPSALQSTHVTLIVLVGTVYGLASVIAAIILPGVPDVRIPEGRWIRPAAAALLLWGFTVTSHAAAGGIGAVVVDWVHLAAAAAWIGGLPALLLTLRAIPPASRAVAGGGLVPRASQVAGISLAVMVVTGVMAATRTVQVLPALVASLYGRALLVKVTLVLFVVTLGALNRFVYRPRIASGRDGPALDRFRRSVVVEVALGVVILLVVGVLTTTPPAAVTQAARTARTIALAGIAGDLRVNLSISPAEPGWNEVRAEVTRIDGGRAVVGANVQVVLKALDHVEDRAFGLPAASGGYAASGDFLVPGWWEVTVVVREGGRSAETTFPLIVAEVPQEGSPGAARLLEQVQRQMGRYQTWREVEQITDGKGNVVVTRIEAQQPDRLRYRTSGGSEAIIIGAVRYGRERGGEWLRDLLPQPLDLEGPYAAYFEGASRARLGRDDSCPGEPCRVLLWELERARASLAARVGTRTHRLHTLAMVAPEHYMTSRLYDLDAAVRILPP